MGVFAFFVRKIFPVDKAPNLAMLHMMHIVLTLDHSLRGVEVLAEFERIFANGAKCNNEKKSANLKCDSFHLKIRYTVVSTLSRLFRSQVETRLHFNFSGSPASGYQMDSAIIAASGITLDAFRPNNTDPDKYQPSLDCQKQPFDIVPIVVGLLLISTVIFVLAAYCLGSRNGRSRRRGYESV